jgi:RNA polymerase sigma factor (sigma-70 family)
MLTAISTSRTTAAGNRSGSGLRRDDVPQLLAAARDGDECAWAVLIQQFQPLLHSIARKCGVPADDLADVSQNVWLIMFRNLHRLRDPAAFTGWIATITRNAGIEARRSSGRTTPIGYADELPAESSVDDAEVDAGMQREECVLAIRSGLARLTPRQRELLLMVTADPPVPYRLISTRLGIPIGSIGPTRARLLRRLAESNDVRRLVDRDSYPWEETA